MTIQTHHLTPTGATERIQTIDMLRGFALLGILLVNMGLFTHSFYYFVLGLQPENMVDKIAHYAVQFFAEGKFYSMFSFLFGLGMAIFMQRAEQKEVPFVRLYSRRLFALLLFGLVHAYLIWIGDILLLYSVIGFLTLFLFRNRKPRTLLIWAGVFLCIPLVINGALWALLALSSMAMGAEVEAATATTMEMYRGLNDAANAAYANGSFAEVTRQRVSDMNMVFATWPFMAFNVWAMFLLGFAAGKSRLHENLAAHKALLKRVLFWGLAVGLVGNLAYVVGAAYSNRLTPDGVNLLALVGQTFGAPALSMFYMAGVALLALQQSWRARFAPVASAGRMAITNYLAQSLICTLIFYGYGLGFYGAGQAACVLLAVIIWLVEVAWSVWWLKHFRFGPVEWLWRTITYWEGQPMRLAAPTLSPTAAGGAGTPGSRAA